LKLNYIAKTLLYNDIMGLFDGKQLEYLEDERKKLWDRLIRNEKFAKELEKQIQKKATDSEKDAAQASRKAAEFRNKAEERYQEASNFVNQIEVEIETARAAVSQINKTKIDIDEEEQSIQETIGRLEELEINYQQRLRDVDTSITRINAFTTKYPDLETKIEEINGFISKVEENLDKSGVSLSALNKRKREVDDLYREIFGYTETSDEDGDATKIEGLKDELESSYNKLSENLVAALEEVEKLHSDYSTKYSEFESGHKEGYKAVKDEIASLLPNALTAGLSAAFSSKKDNEVEASEKLQKNFSLGIYLMIGVSVIPLIISVIFLYQGVTLEQVIMKIPRLVLAIIPMYIPVLWFTYSANKKLNLSKRLIEEYAHKEVLSKTYEGLSTQISNINDKAQSEELKFKLLSNFLQVSAENPGKLISNYEVSDHPIMEALEQSYKFQIAIDRLEGVPGLGKIGAMLESKAKKRMTKREEKIVKALGVDEPEDVED
jgi:predicted  nucleic acid-binding Zn-ribbon protein